jgi:hypothetical protein
MEDNRLKGSPFGAPPQNINVKEDLLKLFRSLIGNRTVDPKALDDTIASQVKPEPVDLGNVIARPTPEQIADAIKDTKKKENIESIRVNLVEDPEKKEEPKKQTGLATLPTKRDIFNEIFIDDNIRNINMFEQYKAPFNNRTVGKGYVSNVLDNVSSYIPDTFDKNKLKSLLMHTADKESAFGSNEGTYKLKKTKRGTVGHGGIQQVTTSGFKNNLLLNPGPTAQKMIQKLKEEKGIDLNKIKLSEQPNTDIQNFLRTPFGSNFAASIFYINDLESPGKRGQAARDLYNSDKYNEKDFRDIFYKGIKKYDEVSNILKDDKIKESKTGGMIESDPYKRQPRFI